MEISILGSIVTLKKESVVKIRFRTKNSLNFTPTAKFHKFFFFFSFFLAGVSEVNVSITVSPHKSNTEAPAS